MLFHGAKGKGRTHAMLGAKNWIIRLKLVGRFICLRLLHQHNEAHDKVQASVIVGKC